MYRFGLGFSVQASGVASPAVRPGRTSDATLAHMAGILGYLAFFLMVATLLWGVLLASRGLERYVRRATLYGGHMTLAVLAIVTSVLHACVHLFRHDAYFDIKKISVPWLGGADTTVSVGILGLEIVLVVAVSVWVQRRISYRRWHRLHWWAYPGFVLIALHTVLATREKHVSPLVIAIAAALVVAVIAAILRMFAPAARPVESDPWFDVVEDQRDRTYFR